MVSSVNVKCFKSKTNGIGVDTRYNVHNGRSSKGKITLYEFNQKIKKTFEHFQVGLIDETAANKEEALVKSVRWLDQFKKISPEARSITKQALRAADIRQLDENRDQDVDLFLFAITQKKVQKGLEMYLESLKKKSG